MKLVALSTIWVSTAMARYGFEIELNTYVKLYRDGQQVILGTHDDLQRSEDLDMSLRMDHKTSKESSFEFVTDPYGNVTR